jgi:7-cyano-7-deazaguanine synthase
MDSTALTQGMIEDGAEVSAISFGYGQKHGKRELEAAVALAQAWGIRHDIVDLSSVGVLLSSGLMANSGPVPEGHYADENMKDTVVPNRNMMMLSIAAAVAISRKFDAVGYAAHAGDHTIYPDCRPEFADAVRKAVRLCDWHNLDLLAPFIHSSKADIIEMVPDTPWEKTWSCYNGRALHCGNCGTCVERREAFRIAGVDDPTDYETTARPLDDLLRKAS